MGGGTTRKKIYHTESTPILGTCAKDLDGMNSIMPSSCPVAKTLYGVKCRSRFSSLSRRSISVTIWMTWTKYSLVCNQQTIWQAHKFYHKPKRKLLSTKLSKIQIWLKKYLAFTNWSCRRSSPFLNIILQIPPFVVRKARRNGCNALLNIDDSDGIIPEMRTPGASGDRIGWKYET